MNLLPDRVMRTCSARMGWSCASSASRVMCRKVARGSGAELLHAGVGGHRAPQKLLGSGESRLVATATDTVRAMGFGTNDR